MIFTLSLFIHLESTGLIALKYSDNNIFLYDVDKRKIVGSITGHSDKVKFFQKSHDLINNRLIKSIGKRQLKKRLSLVVMMELFESGVLLATGGIPIQLILLLRFL